MTKATSWPTRSITCLTPFIPQPRQHMTTLRHGDHARSKSSWSTTWSKLVPRRVGAWPAVSRFFSTAHHRYAAHPCVAGRALLAKTTAEAYAPRLQRPADRVLPQAGTHQRGDSGTRQEGRTVGSAPAHRSAE